VLLPFSSGKHVQAADRVEADQTLRRMMKKEAGKAASTIIAIGEYFHSTEAHTTFRDIITKVEQLLPESTCQRLLESYSWLLVSTFKVSSMT